MKKKVKNYSIEWNIKKKVKFCQKTLFFYLYVIIFYEKIILKGEIFMRNYKVKTKVKNNFNDTKTNITYEKDDDIILDRARYEELLSKGFVEEGKILEDKPLFKKEEKED